MFATRRLGVIAALSVKARPICTLPVIGVLLTVTVGAARAQSCGPLPNTLTNNTIADATQVMANFNTLLNCANSNGAIGTGTAGQVPYYGAAGNTLSAISLSGLLDATFGSAQGSILYRGSNGWTLLPPGNNGYVLQTGGTSSAPSWAPPATGGGGIGTIVGAGVSSSAATVAVPGNPVITRPALSAFTWVNQASATATDNANGPLVLQTLQNTSENNVSALVKPVIGASWTLTIEYAVGNHTASGADYAGLVVYNNTTGRLYVCGLNGLSYIDVGEYSSTSSSNANVGSMAILGNPGIVWTRANYNSTSATLTFSYSIDGFTWQPIYSTSAPYVGVATDYGIALGSFSNTNGYMVSLNYFVDSSP